MSIPEKIVALLSEDDDDEVSPKNFLAPFVTYTEYPLYTDVIINGTSSIGSIRRVDRLGQWTVNNICALITKWEEETAAPNCDELFDTRDEAGNYLLGLFQSAKLYFYPNK